MAKYKMKFKDESYLETKKKELLEEVEHSAKYLWTWEAMFEGPHFAQAVREASLEDNKDYTREDAIKLLDEYYEELKKVVDSYLKEGYEAKLKKLNLTFYRYDAMKNKKEE